MAKSIVDDKARINNIIENIEFCIENIKMYQKKIFRMT